MVRKTADSGVQRTTRSRWAKMKGALARRTLQAAVVVAVASSVPQVLGAGGGMQVNNVAAGSASFVQQGHVTTVTTGSQNTIINYDHLSVYAGNTLRFVQPTVTSRVLNRIQGSAPTRIDGSLLSNGIVYLVNPAGILFGQGAVINVGQFYAAAGHLSDSDFMAGNNHFTGMAGDVTNAGKIQADQVHLAGLHVANFGAIVTGPQGIVTMTAGKDVYLGVPDSPASAPHVMVKISADTSGKTGGTGVTNAGSIHSGTVELGAGDVYAAGIYSGGEIKALSVEMDGGKNTAIAGGSIDASNTAGKGGDVTITGDKVGLAAAKINVSGTGGGGTVKIGGDFHGAGDTPTSTETVVTSGTVIRADGVGNADGGSVAVWSDGTTRFGGLITARGGALGGNGGLVEVSGKQHLTFAGQVNTLAPMGITGTLLMDPANITVTLGGVDLSILGSGVSFGDADVGGDTLDVGLITGLTNVVLQATNNVEIATSVTLTTAGSGFKAEAGKGIFIDPGVAITTQGGTIELSAGSQTPGAGGPLLPGDPTGALTIGSGAVLDTTAGGGNGNIILRAGGLSVDATAQFKAGTATVTFATSDGLRTIGVGTATGQDVIIDGNAIGAIKSAGAVVIGATNQEANITVQGADLSGLAASVSLVQDAAGAGAVSLDDNGGTALKANGAVSITAGTGGIGAAQDTAGNAEITTGGQAITLSSGADVGSTAKRIEIGSGSGAVSVTAPGTVALAGIADLALGSISGGTTATVDLISGGSITASGTVAGATVTLNATTGIGTSAASRLDISSPGAVSLTAGGDVFVSSGGSLSFSGISAGSNAIDVKTTGGGNIEATGALVGGTVTLEADGGIGTLGAVQLTTSGATALTAHGAAAAGDISVSFGSGDLSTSNLTVTMDGTGVHALSVATTGAITVDGDLNTGTSSLALSAATIDGNGTAKLDGASISLTTTGALGGTTAVDIGTAVATTIDSVGDAHLIYHSALITSDLTVTAVGSVLTIEGDSISIDSALTNTGGTIALKSNTGGITDGGGSVTAGVISLDSKTGVGLSGAAVKLSATTSGSVTTAGNAAAGDIFVDLGTAISAPFTFTANGTGVQDVLVSNTGAVVVGAGLSAGTDNLFVSAAGVTVNTGVTLSGANVGIFGGAADIFLAGTIDATGGTAWLQAANIAQSAGTIKADNLGARSTGTTGTQGISLTQSNQIAVKAALTNTAGGGDVSLTTSGPLTLDSVTGVGPTGGVPADITSSTSNGANLTVNAGGTLTVTSAVDAGTGTASLKATGGDIVGAGTVSGGSVTLNADGAIGTSTAAPLNITVGAGNVSLTTGGNGAAGNVELGVADGFATSKITTLSLGGTGTKTVELVGAGSVTVDSAISIGSNNFTVDGTGFSETNTGGVTAGIFTINSTGAQSVGGVNSVGTFLAGGSSFSLTSTGSVTVSTGVLQIGTSGALSLAGTLTQNAASALILQGSTINQTAGSVSGSTLVAKATGAAGPIGVVLGQTGNGLQNISVGSSVVGGAVTVTSSQALTLTSTTTALTGTVAGVQASGGDISLTGASVALGNVVSTSGAGNVSISGAAGITGASTVTGHNVSLSTATAAIGAPGAAINVSASNSVSLTTTGSGSAGDIHVAISGITNLGSVTVSTDGITNALAIGGQAVELRGLATLDSVVDFKKDSVTFVGTGGSLTETAAGNITAANISLIADSVTILGTLHAPSGTIAIAPFTSGAPLTVSGLPAGSTAALFQFGNATTGDVTLAGGLNLTGSGANLTIQAGPAGSIIFNTTVTLDTSKTMKLIGSKGIVALAAGDSVKGSGATVVFSNIGGDIGSTVHPFEMDVAHLGNGVDGAISMSVPGNVYITNDSALAIDGTATFGAAANDSFIHATSLTVNQAVNATGSFTLQANNDALNAGNDLTVAADVKSSGGNVTLNAGDNFSQTAGTISGATVALNANLDGTGDAVDGAISQSAGSISTASLTAQADGINLLSLTNAYSAFSAVNGATGVINVFDTGGLTLGAVTQSGTLVGINSTGSITQSAALSKGAGAGFGLVVTSTSGSINLNLGNDIGNGEIDLASNAISPANAAITFASAGDLHVGIVNTAGTATLQAVAAIDQTAGALHGIHSSGLVISGTTATLNVLDTGNSINSFSSLAANLTGAGTSDIHTRAAGGLTLGPVSFPIATPTAAISVTGTLNLTNETGAVSSTNVVNASTLNVTAQGGINLSNTGNAISTTSLTNAGAGNINLVSGVDLTVSGVSQAGGGGTSVSAGGNLTFNGTANAGVSLAATTTLGGKLFTNNAVISSTGPVAITADQMALNGGSSISTTGGTPSVTLTSETASVQIGINEADGAGVLGLTAAELATINVGTTVGNVLQIGDAAHTGDIVNGGGSVTVTAPTRFVTQGNVTLSGLTWNYTPGPVLGTNDLALEVRHDGTLALGALTLDGAFSENNVAGTGAGGNVTVAGNISTSSHTVTFNDKVILNGDITIDTTTSGTGAAIAFHNTVDGPGSLTVTAGAGTVLTQSVGGATPLGVGGFTQNGTGLFTVNGSITTAGGAINIHGPALVTTNTVLATTGSASPGANVNLFSSVGAGASSLKITAGVGSVTVLGAITTTSTFDSSGTVFANTAAGTVSAAGITINHTGLVSISGALDGLGNNVAITGAGITTSGTGTINGADVQLAGTTGTVQVGAGVTGSLLVHSTGAGFTNTAQVQGLGVTIDHTGSAVNLDAKVDAGTGDVLVKGSSITSNTSGLINGGAITLTSTGAVNLSGAITGGGDFNSTGTTFTNASTATVSAAGITVNHSGLVTINGSLKGDDVALTGNGIITTGTGTIDGANVTLAGTTGTVSVGAAVTGSGLFLSTGVGFTNTASVTADGVTITHTAGPVLIEAALDGTGGDVGIKGTTITSTALGTIHGAVITLTAGTDVSLVGNVTGGGLFTSTGAKFTNTGSITAAGVLINHTGDVNADGAIDGTGDNVDITGNSFTSSAAGTLKGAAITITSTNGVSIDGQVTAGSLFKSTGTSFLNENTGSIAAMGVTINHSGDVTFDAGIDGTTGDVLVNGHNIASDTDGTINGGAITLTAGADVSLTGNVTGGALFTSTGVKFTNTGSITAVGVTVNHTGNVLFEGAIDGTTADVLVHGVDITSTSLGTVNGRIVTLTATGNVTLAGNVTGGGLFTSTGVNFKNTGSVTAAGILIDHSGTVLADGALNGSGLDVTIDGSTITTTSNGTIDGAAITLTSGGLVSIDGKINGSGLFESTGSTFLNENSGSITAAGVTVNHTGDVTFDAAIDGTTGDVLVKGHNIGSDTDGTIHGGLITLTATGNVNLAGNVTGGGLFTSTGVDFTNTGAITAAGILIDHTGNVLADGALKGSGLNVDIDGATITTTANGTIDGAAITLTSAGLVKIDGKVTGSDLFTSTGTTFLNEGTGSITALGVTITHSDDVTFHAAIDGTTGDVLVHGKNITSNTDGTINGAVITLTATADVSLDGDVTGTGLFTSTGINFTNNGSITAAGITIDHTGNVLADGALNGLGLDVNITGLTITTTANGTIDGAAITLASTGFVSIDGKITGAGLFKSTGTSFLNEGTGSITALGVNIDHSGDVTFHAAIDGTTANVDVTGDNITSDIHGTINGDAITLTAAGDVFLDGDVTGTGLFTSTGVNFTNNGSITTVGVTVTHTGNVLFSGPVNAQSGDVLVHGVNITSDSDGTINGAVITLTASGNVLLNGNVTGSGLFTSTGVDFTNHGSVTAAGILIDHTGNVLADGALNALGLNVDIDGATITTTANGTIDGAAITLTSAGLVSIDGKVTGSGLFKSTGTSFLNEGTGSITAVGVTIDHTGDVTFHAAIDGTSGDVLVTGDNITSDIHGTINGAVITLTAAGNVSLDGNVTGSGLFTSTGVDFTNNGSITAEGVVVTHTGNVLFNGAVDGQTGDVLVHGVNITSTSLGTINGATITLTALGNVSLAGNVTGSGLFTSTGVDFTNTGSITAAGILIDHTGNVLADGALNALGLNVDIDGATITTTANGTIDGAAITLTSAGFVSIDGKVTGSGLFKSTGTSFLNEGTGSITADGVTIDHSGDVTFHAAIDGTSGDVLVNGHDITSNIAGTIHGGIITLTATGNVNLAGNVTGSGLFTSTGIDFTNTGSITAAGIDIIHTGNVLADGALDALGLDVNISGSSITTTANGTINGNAITLTAVNGVSIDGTVTGSGLFKSTGTTFLNEGTGSITAVGVTIDHTGDVTFHAAIDGTSGDVLVNGNNITSSTAGTINGAIITLTAAADVSLDGNVTGTGLFTSTGVNFTNNGSITAEGVVVTHTGNVLFNGAVNGQAGDVLVHGVDITSTALGTINGATITLTALGNVSLAGNVTGSGLFTSTGVDFTNTGSITSAGILIDHTGNVLADGALNALGLNVDIDGATITTTANGTIDGAAITLTSAGLVSIDGKVTGSGLFKSTGTSFLNEGTGSITAAGVTIDHTGDVTFHAAIDGTSGDVLVNGDNITSDVNGTINGAVITLTAAGNVSLDGNVTGGGLFTSTGVDFTNNGSITAQGVTVNHTGNVLFNGAVDGQAGDVLVNGIDITSTTNGTINGATITLTAGGNVSLAAAVTGSGAFTSTGVNFTNTASITAAGITVTHTGAVNIQGALAAGADDILLTGTSIASTVPGTMNGHIVTLTATAGDVTVGGIVTATGLFTSTGVAFTNTASITGLGLTIDHTGAVNIQAALDGTTANVLIDGSSFVSTVAGTINGAAITLHSGNGVRIGGVVTGTGLFTSTGVNFLNTASISASAITLTHTGLVTFSANLTAGAGAGAASITGAGVNQTDGVLKAGTLLLKGTGTFTLNKANLVGKLAADIHGPLSYTNNIDLVVGLIGSTSGISTHDAPLHLTLTNGNLLVNQAITTGTGGITFNVPNGSVTDLGLLTTTGGFTSTGINFSNNAPITTTSITLHHSGVASINAALTATHGDIIDDAKTVLGANLKASGNIKAPQHILLANGPRTVTAGGASGILLGSIGGIDASATGNDLTLTTSLISGTPTIEVGAMGSNAKHLGNVHFFSAHDVRLDGDIFASTLIFEDDVPGSPANVPSIATVERNGDLTIDLTGEFSPPQAGVVLPVDAPISLLKAGANFYMERGSKLSVFSTTPGANGDLTIDTHGHNMVVGDISALGKITLNAGSTDQTITVLNRAAAQVLQPNGTLSAIDHGTDIVAGFQGPGALIFTGTVQVNQFLGATDADRVQIASFAGSADLAPVFGKLGFDNNSTKIILTVDSFNTLTAADFQGPGNDVLDIIAFGVGNNPASSQGSVIPRDVQAIAPEQSAVVSGALLESLHQIGIYARGLKTDEVVEFLIGRALYDDVPLKLNPTAEDNQVTANRLPYQPVFPTVDAYKRLFLKTVTGPDGKQTVEAQDTTIRNTLGQTWNLYRAKMQGKETPEGFRAFLEAGDKSDPRYAQALSYLDQLRDLLAAIKNLGLTTMEFEVSKTTILARVRPSNIRDTDFMNVVTGPSTRRALTSAR